MKIKVGDWVKWTHKRGKSFNYRTFEASGTVKKIFVSSTSGKRNFTKVARIEVDAHPYWKSINRKSTVITLSKLF